MLNLIAKDGTLDLNQELTKVGSRYQYDERKGVIGNVKAGDLIQISQTNMSGSVFLGGVPTKAITNGTRYTASERDGIRNNRWGYVIVERV
tara:strand:+ start:878 stop:1150 length:273 start_codon:yes stop_codon:yes gene_type:complete